MAKETKKYIAPNECSLGRWIAVLAVGLLIGFALSAPFSFCIQTQTTPIMGLAPAEFYGLLSFIPLFWGMVLALKVVGKTSLKDFVLGVGGTANKKDCLILAVLFVVGFVLCALMSAGNIHLRGVNPGQFAFLILFVLLTSWMQTSWEELIFRGIVGRWACKNQLGFTAKAVIAGVVSSLLFALSHCTNPEVTSQSGVRVVLAIVTYAIPGLVCFLANLHFGNLLPGLLIHWLNNSLLFTMIGTEVSAMPVPTLLVDSTPYSAEWMLLSTVVTHLPIVVYLVVMMAKNKKAAAAG